MITPKCGDVCYVPGGLQAVVDKVNVAQKEFQLRIGTCTYKTVHRFEDLAKAGENLILNKEYF